MAGCSHMPECFPSAEEGAGRTLSQGGLKKGARCCPPARLPACPPARPPACLPAFSTLEQRLAQRLLLNPGAAVIIPHAHPLCLRLTHTSSAARPPWKPSSQVVSLLFFLVSARTCLSFRSVREMSRVFVEVFLAK